MGNTIGFTAALYSQTLFDLHWEMWLSWLHARFYRRLRLVLGFLALAAAGFALGALVADFPGLCTLALGALSGLAVLGWRWSVAGRIARYTAAYESCLQLVGAPADTPMRTVENRLRMLQAESVPALDSLRWVAYNAAIRTSGIGDDPQPLNAWQRGLGYVARAALPS